MNLTPSQIQHLQKIALAGEFMETRKRFGQRIRNLKGMNLKVMDELTLAGLLVRESRDLDCDWSSLSYMLTDAGRDVLKQGDRK